MEQRISYSKVAPEGIQALGGLETYLRSSGLEPDLLNLIKTRASQLNGCAYCIDMHTKAARARGETEQRLYPVLHITHIATGVMRPLGISRESEPHELELLVKPRARRAKRLGESFPGALVCIAFLRPSADLP